jgi:hypothetical protein
MESDRVNRWLTLGANIGVLVGLIFLVAEIRHTNDLARASAYRSRGAEIQEAHQAVALDPELSRILLKYNQQGIEGLTDHERIRYTYWQIATQLRMQNQFNDYQLGFLDEEIYQSVLDAAAERYDLWMELGVPIDDPEFAAAIEGVRKSRANSE